MILLLTLGGLIRERLAMDVCRGGGRGGCGVAKGRKGRAVV